MSTGERQLIKQNTDRFDGYQFDNAGKLRLSDTHPGIRRHRARLRFNAQDGKATKVYSCNVFETCYPVRFHKDNRRVFMITNKGDIDLIRLVLLDPETGKEETVESDPMNRVDFGTARFSEVTDELIYTTYDDDKPRTYFKDKAFESDYKVLQEQLPAREIAFGSSTKDESVWMVTAWSDTEPGETYLFDRKTKKLTKQYSVRQRLPRGSCLGGVRVRSLQVLGRLGDSRVSDFAERCGREEPGHNHHAARRTLGPGYVGLQTVYAQFAANRGYAVLQPNFRTSTGFGKKYRRW